MELKGKVIYAYNADKHRLGCYGYMADIEDVKNGLVYCYAKDNPKNYQHFTLKLENVKKWINEKLYKIR